MFSSGPVQGRGRAHRGVQCVRVWEISCLVGGARALERGSAFIECTPGICALVDSSNIPVNLIKYIVSPIEGILISWVRNKLFSLLLQMKTSLFCREACPWLLRPLLLLPIGQILRTQFSGCHRGVAGEVREGGRCTQ